MAWMQTVLDQSAFSARLRAIFLTEDSIVEVGYSQLPASKPSALINGFSVRMRIDKTQHINTVF
jgi:hypothetical protein